jgi:hypothetical protein
LVVLPETSVAVQVTTFVPIGKLEPEGGLQMTGTGASQLSNADKTVKETTASHLPAAVCVMMLAGQTICGGWVSVTVTWNVHELVFPAASVATQFTAVVPVVNVEPDGGVQTTAAPGQLSETSTLKFTTAEQRPGAASTWISDGHAICGGSVSRTITLKAQLVLLPARSVAVQITVLVPFGNTEPGGVE